MRAKKKWLKAFAWLCAIAFIGLMGNHILTRVIEKKAGEALKTVSPEIRTDFSSIHVHLFEAAVSIHNLHVLVPAGAGHQHSFSCAVVSLRGINLLALARRRELVVSTVSAGPCRITLDQFLLHQKDSVKALFNGLHVPFKKIRIGEIKFKKITAWLRSGKGGEHARLLLKGEAAVDEVVLKRALHGAGQSRDSLHFGSIQCNFSDVTYSFSHGYYTLHIKRILADSKQQVVRMDAVKLVPRYGKFEFSRKLRHQADRMEGTIARINLLKVNVDQLLHKRLRADKLVVNGAHFSIFRDRRLPRPLEKQPMLNGYLKKIPYEVRIRSVELNHSSVRYEEFPEDGTESGILKIGKIQLTASPVLNHPSPNDPGYLQMHVRGLLMDAGMIQAHIRVPFTKDTSYIRGSIRNLDLPKLNSSAENLGRFHIESGLLNELDFHFAATRRRAEGAVTGEYHNLVIDKLKSKKGVKEKAKVPSFFLRHLIIPKNKDKSMNVARRSGKISYARDSTRRVSYYYVKALLSGVRSSFALGFFLPK